MVRFQGLDVILRMMLIAFCVKVAKVVAASYLPAWDKMFKNSKMYQIYRA